MGKYLVEVHQCVTPQIREQDGEGTSWQCDCGKAYEVHHSGTVPYGPSYSTWLRIAPARINTETGEVMSRIEWSRINLEQFANSRTKKKWWQR
jgi:hypothetical protein